MRMRRRIFIVGLLLSLIPIKSIQSKIPSSVSAKTTLSKTSQSTQEKSQHDQYVLTTIEVFVESKSVSFVDNPLPGGGILIHLKTDLNIARGPPKIKI